MRPIRILLTGVPRLEHELLTEAFTREHDMRVVDSTNVAGQCGPEPVPDADVVISELRGSPTPGIRPETIAAETKRSVLMVTIDGKQVMLFEIRPQHRQLYDPSVEELVAVIRETMTRWQNAAP